MNRIATRLVSVFLAVLQLAGLTLSAQLTAFAEDDPYHATGYCGADDGRENVAYFLFDDGSIAFFGKGAMQDFENPAFSMPAGYWYITNPMEALTGSKIAIEDGITRVGNYAFYLPMMYTMVLQTYNVDLPNSLESIGKSAFENQNKLEKITIPKNVTLIGEKAFSGCTKLQHVDYYGNPENIKKWASDVFSQNVTVHIKPEYENKVSELNESYNGRHMFFEANLHSENLSDDGIERNIKAYIGQESSRIFAGAVPSVVVGTFSGSKKSVTAGNNGFVSAVKIENDYYLHTNNHSGDLNKANIATTGGAATSVQTTAHASLKLKIRYEYVGTNIVTVIYDLQNSGDTDIDGISLGGTGDIKIGADDTARIEPLYAEGSSAEQIGFYMQSGKNYDKDGDTSATLGFIGKGVKFGDNQTSESANFFYGKAGTNAAESATGAYQLRLMPERIFTMNNDSEHPDAHSVASGAFPEQGAADVDSGMSYYWDNISVPARQTISRAVMFSVYGAGENNAGSALIEEAKPENFHTVTWKDGDGHELLKQVVKSGDKTAYDGAVPEKVPQGSTAYVFNNTWKYEDDSEYNNNTAITDDTTLIAQFDAIPNNRLFVGHSLSLDGDIGVNFFLDKAVADKVVGTNTNLAAGKMGVVHFSWTVKGEEQTNSAYYTVGQATQSVKIKGTDKACYVVKCDVPAPEMAYNIHAVAYIDGKEHWDKDDYSVKAYGEEIIAHPNDYDEKLVTLAKEMLNYGAKCQIVFDREEASAPLANEKLPADYSMAQITESHFDTAISNQNENLNNGQKSVMRANTGSLTYRGSSVVYLTKTSLRHYYTVKGGGEYTGTYTINDDDDTAHAFTKKDVFVYTEIQDIAAAKLDVLQAVTFNGNTYYFSVLDYAKLLYTQGDTNEKNLGWATYLYNQAANAYFDQNNGGQG